MEALTRLVSDSLARQGLDRPVDPRRLQWSHWFRCDSPHSLLVVPSKPGIFALAEEIMELGSMLNQGGAHWEKNDFSRADLPATSSQALAVEGACGSNRHLGGAAFQRCESEPEKDTALATEVPSKRMLAVVQFSEDDNMAYVLDRMFTWVNPMRARLHSGNCFVRFVVVEDQQQRRAICAALNQWMRNSAEKATGLPSDFSSSLELASETVARVPSPTIVLRARNASVGADPVGSLHDSPAPVLSIEADSGAHKNLHCPQPFPSGF
jgi:hypothetical protein